MNECNDNEMKYVSVLSCMICDMIYISYDILFIPFIVIHEHFIHNFFFYTRANLLLGRLKFLKGRKEF